MAVSFREYLGVCPIISILRGVVPEEVVSIGEALVGAGVGIIEVPLNSPRAMDSIALLADVLGGRALIGAGTVLTVDQVTQVASVGGRLIVAPNMDPQVIEASLESGQIPVPGVYSPSEAFAAVRVGARVLKLFPAIGLGDGFVRQLRVVLPPQVDVVAVGGVGADNLADWFGSGVAGVGIGASLYAPGDTPEQVTARASRLAVIVKNLPTV